MVTARCHDGYAQLVPLNSRLELGVRGRLHYLAGVSHWVQHEAADEVNWPLPEHLLRQAGPV